MPGCKVGDLALVMGATVTPQFNGMIVKVLRRPVTGEDLGNGCTPVSAEVGARSWVVEHASGFRLPHPGVPFGVKIRLAQDRILFPIRPDELKDEQTEKEKELEKV